jgi:serine/threonine-protein kinase
LSERANEALDLEKAFRELEEAGRSGILRVSKNGLETRVYFRRGRIVSTASDAESEELGRSLVERGKLELCDLELARETMEKSGKPLAEVLTDLSLLPTPEVDAAAAEIERNILDAILSTPGEVRIDLLEKTDELDQLVPRSRLNLNPTEVLLEGRKGALGLVRDDLNRVVRWVAQPPIPFQETTLSTKESALLDFLRAPSTQGLTAAQIVEQSPLCDEDTVRVLSALIAAGVVELRDAGVRDGIDLSSTLAGAGPSPESLLPTSGSGFPSKLGRFEVERALGRGSMGAVLLAKDPAIDRVVAIKLIQTASHLSPAQRDKYRERFYREASSAGQLLHPAIATVFDVGHSPDGTPFIIMEFLKGETLREILERERLALQPALRIARDLLEALSFAHSQGIVHRDVKPTNVMVTPEYRAKIMDFGIAHVVGSELTAAEDVLGSPYYMAPEQLSKGPIGPRTDLFSFAVVLYRMLTGVLPFTGDSFAAIAHAILHEKPVPPDRIDPRIPPSLSRVVLRCLEKSPGDRYASASEVLGALDAIESGKELPAAEPSPSSRSGARLALLLTLLLASVVAARMAQRTPPPVGSGIAAAPPPPTTAPEVPAAQVVPAPLPSLSPRDTIPEASVAKVETRPRPRPSRPARTDVREISPSPVWAPTEAELFYNARVALERGELAESKTILEELLARNPSLAGASELYLQVTDQIWEQRLPIMIAARHRHRLGACEGELTLTSLGIRYTSSAHDWAFPVEEIRVVERPDESTLFVETFEKDLLSLGKNKRYKFELTTSLVDADWTRYQRVLN